METNNSLQPGDFLEILSRRKWSLILPALAIIIVTATVALVLPPVYQSSSVILIEEKGIPDEYVRATITSYAEQRIQSIKQRVLSTSRLLEVIRKFDLYREYRKKETTDEIVARMKDDIALTPISAEVQDRRTGRLAEATIAFSISYEGRDPQKVRQVVNVLTSDFLSKDIEVREKMAEETTSFLEEEKNRVKENLTLYEGKIADFREKHIDEMPEALQVNLQSLNDTERFMERVKQQYNAMKEREEYLKTQLLSVEPLLENSDSKRLEELNMQLTHLLSRFTREHPDVVKMKAEISRVEVNLARSGEEKGKTPDNPAYITLSSQLASTRADMEANKRELAELKNKHAEFKRRIAAAPKVQEAYNAILIEHRSTQAKYDDLLRKVMEASVAQGLEREQKGERFTLVEPPRLPEKPLKPNRWAVVLIGVLLGFGVGLGMVFMREFSDNTIRDADQLSLATSIPVLATIPCIITEGDRVRMRLQRSFVVLITLASIVGGVTAFHVFVMDLDVFWAKIMRNIPI